MLLIYAVVMIVVGLAVFSITRYSSVHTPFAAAAAVVAALIALIFTYLFVAPQYYTWKIETMLKTRYPVFELLAEKSPDDFNAFVTKIKSDILTSPSNYNEFRDTGNFLNSEMIKYSQTATNESLYNFARVISDFYGKLFQINPVFILNLEFPEKFQDQINFNELEKASRGEIAQVTSAKEGVIRSALDEPQPVLSKEESQKAQAIFRQIITNLVDKYGKNTVLASFQHPEDAATDKKTAATIIMEFYNDLIARGEMDTGIVLKYLFKAGSSSS
jgi:hypothetical protein